MVYYLDLLFHLHSLVLGIVVVEIQRRKVLLVFGDRDLFPSDSIVLSLVYSTDVYSRFEEFKVIVPDVASLVSAVTDTRDY